MEKGVDAEEIDNLGKRAACARFDDDDGVDDGMLTRLRGYLFGLSKIREI